ncbi:MAG TPA: hypothetical protein VG222_07830 [Vicinamibacterales bacterium]|jgi:hypothetical protein|nr:hypothetical protein [Vicinamibacterales bacterium]
MRRVVSDAMMTAGSALALVAGLVMIDANVREQISLRLSTASPATLAAAGNDMRDLTAVVWAAARDQTLSHAPLAIFTLAAVVLVLFMLRT